MNLFLPERYFLCTCRNLNLMVGNALRLIISNLADRVSVFLNYGSHKGLFLYTYRKHEIVKV